MAILNSFLDIYTYFLESAGNPIILLSLGIFACEFLVYLVYSLMGKDVK